MQKLILLLSCLACVGHGRRVNEQLERHPVTERQNSMQADETSLSSKSPRAAHRLTGLAGLLLAFNPAGGHSPFASSVLTSSKFARQPLTYMQLPQPESYDEACARGNALFEEGKYQQAMVMFETAKKLPGDGRDMVRAKKSEVTNLAGWQANPQVWVEDRFATEEQLLNAEIQIAACHSASGDTPKAMEIINEVVAQLSDPVRSLNVMISEECFEGCREELLELRKEIKAQPRGLWGFVSDVSNAFRR